MWSIHSKLQTHCLDSHWLMFKSEELGKVRNLLDQHRSYFCVIRKKDLALFLLQERVFFSSTKWCPYQDNFLSSGTSCLHVNVFGGYI